MFVCDLGTKVGFDKLEARDALPDGENYTILNNSVWQTDGRTER